MAASLAARHPERVSALVLAAPAANLASVQRLDRWLAAPVAGYPGERGIALPAGPGAVGGPVRRRVAAARGSRSEFLIAAGRSLLKRRALAGFVAEQRALLRDLPALERALPRIAAPTTILTGAEDRIVPPAAPRRLAEQIPGARLVVAGARGAPAPPAASAARRG